MEQGVFLMSSASRHRSGIVGFVLLYVAFLISYVDRSAISLALGQIGKDFDLQATDFGIIISAFFLGYAVMQIPGGWLADRFGSKYVIVVTIAMWSVFTVMTSFAWSLASLIVIRLVFGLTEGAFPAASFKGLAELFDRPDRPKLAALLTSSNYAGSMLAPLIMAPLIIALGWRYAFEAIGFAGIAFALVYVVLVPHVLPAAVSDIEPASTGARAPTEKAPMRQLLKDPFLWQLMTVWFGLSCVNKGLDSWMPIYLLQRARSEGRGHPHPDPVPAGHDRHRHRRLGHDEVFSRTGEIPAHRQRGAHRHLPVRDVRVENDRRPDLFPVAGLFLQIVRAGDRRGAAEQDPSRGPDRNRSGHDQFRRPVRRLCGPNGDGLSGDRHRLLRRGVRLPARHDDPGGGGCDDDQEPRSIG